MRIRYNSQPTATVGGTDIISNNVYYTGLLVYLYTPLLKNEVSSNGLKHK